MNYNFPYLKATITANVSAISSLNKAVQIVFSLIKSNPKITRSEISTKINKTIRTVQRITDQLVEKWLSYKNRKQPIWLLGGHRQ